MLTARGNDIIVCNHYKETCNRHTRLFSTFPYDQFGTQLLEVTIAHLLVKLKTSLNRNYKWYNQKGDQSYIFNLKQPFTEDSTISGHVNDSL